MINRILLAITLGLIFFQIAFSVYYSNLIVSYNRQFGQLQKKYQELKFENQKLEIDFANKYAINGNKTP